MTTRPYGGKESATMALQAVYKELDSPYSAMIEIADRCNEVCIHCYQVQGQKGEMSTEELKGVIDQLADMGVLMLVISGGEPTLRADFLDIVTHARARRFAVKLYTNGLNMTAELAAELARLAVQEVQISLYSHEAETHDWVTRVPGSFKKTTAGVRFLREVGIPVVLKTPLMAFNADQFDKWIDLVTSLGADYAMDPHLNGREDGDRNPERLRVSDDAFLRVRSNPRLSRLEPGYEPNKPLDSSLCGACTGNVHIEANGEIRPCTQMTVPVGNALTEGVVASWKTNPEAKRIRSIRWGDVHGCRDCDLRHFCSRCFADAQSEGGDALGPYESACHKARLRHEVVRGTPPVFMPAENGRDDRLGPYREVDRGTFQPIDDVVQSRDRQLAKEHNWVRSEPHAAPGMAARPGELVQIRRPGKKPGAERVPGG